MNAMIRTALLLPLLLACLPGVAPRTGAAAPADRRTEKTVHVYVALCDNKSQGIVPVPATLGNGDDPRNNLYWGAQYGVKAFLRRSANWTPVGGGASPDGTVMERIVLRHRTRRAWLVADAYRGSKIRTAVASFLAAAAGHHPEVLEAGGAALGTHGKADLVAFVGHNGLMDFSMEAPKRRAGDGGRAAVVLACKSRPYFRPILSGLGCKPVLLTTGLMAPEAYTLEAALEAWLSGKGAAGMKEGAARAYDRYQQCGLTGSRRLFHAEEGNNRR
jgi:hypothetical protein